MGSTHAAPLRLTSPDGKLTVSVNAQPEPAYSVTWNGNPLITPSRLGFDLGEKSFPGAVAIKELGRAQHDSTWKTVVGERSEVRDHYNELTLSLTSADSASRPLTMTFRAYNEGIAFNYTFPESKGAKPIEISRELTEFCFPGDYPAWAAYAAQAKYSKTPLSQLKAGAERPMTIEAGPTTFIALAEAKLVDYARGKFSPVKDKPHALAIDLHGAVSATAPLTTPWRVIMVAESPGQLLEQNYLLLNLNDPCAIADTSWIKPGKVLREVTLTTTGGKACVDFAVKHQLEYILFDAGWYGHEYSKEADATTVTVDPKRSKGPLDLPEVIRYASERGVGTILYVNQNALTPQLDEILPLYQKWGIKGVKYGFVHVGSQKDTTWLHEAIRKAAAHHLMVDIHDEYRPTGYERTYPNLMTAEGIAGDETSPSNQTTLAHLFNRSLAGPADNTVCYYDGRVTRNASHAYQLAKSVCIYSAWQFLFWYDRPPGSPGKVGGAGGAETGIGDEPELEFFSALPASWDETRVLHGSVGEFAVIARRRGGDWFIGVMNSGQPRRFDLPLEFLGPGKFNARIYADDPLVETRTKVGIRNQEVNRATTLKAEVSAQGGQAIHLTPLK